MTKRIQVLGIPVDCVNMQSAVDIVDGMIAGDSAQMVLAVNPEKIIKAQQRVELRSALEGAGLLIPDGIGVVLATRLLGLGRMSQVPGSELMPALCDLAMKKGYGVFLYGASPDVNAKAAEMLVQRYPGIRIAGREHGFAPPESMPALIEKINSSGAQILFVALGSPQQELWMNKYREQLRVKVCQGVGGTFDVIAGRVRRAPYLFRRMHLEWLYRLLAQPKRLLRQTALPKFVFQVLRVRFFG
jgi:N-acetylglucosaminyldiphosphoundecaprenol N-acetyl-beta-D-mannosaminyltransferase